MKTISSIPLVDLISSPSGLSMKLTGANGFGVLSDVSVNFNDYLKILYTHGISMVPTEEYGGKILNVGDLTNDSNDILKDLAGLIDRNKSTMLNSDAGNLPDVPGNPMSPTPNLSFLKRFDLPPPGVAILFGAYGRGLILASQNYVAEKIKNELFKIAKGNEYVIEIAEKISSGIKSAAQVQYLLAQPTITPLGVGMVTPI